MDTSNINLAHLLPLLIPIALLEFGLLIWALLDLIRRKSVKGNKVVWILVIVLINIIGPIVYFIFGRGDDSSDEEE